MRKLMVLPCVLACALALGVVASRLPTPADAASTRATTIPFGDARLKIEFNSTDGDAGLQVFLDAEPWRHISITNPRGHKIANFTAQQVIRNYGLTELFSESSEPPFAEFPFEEFKKLFPEGTYTFSGKTIEGESLLSTFVLTHDVPAGPRINTPAEDATVPRRKVVVDWSPVTKPAGINIVAYQVLVVADTPALGNPKRVLDVMLPATTTKLPIPSQFLTPGAYKTEVLAIEASGNQTLTEIPFTVS